MTGADWDEDRERYAMMQIEVIGGLIEPELVSVEAEVTPNNSFLKAASITALVTVGSVMKFIYRARKVGPRSAWAGRSGQTAARYSVLLLWPSARDPFIVDRFTHHEWVFDKANYPVCRVCGLVRQSDERKVNPSARVRRGCRLWRSRCEQAHVLLGRSGPQGWDAIVQTENESLL